MYCAALRYDSQESTERLFKERYTVRSLSQGGTDINIIKNVNPVLCA